MRIIIIAALLIMATSLQAQTVDTIAVHDSLVQAPAVADSGAPRRTDSAQPASPIPVPYPAGRAIGTFALANLTKAGAACLGGLAGAALGTSMDTLPEGGGDIVWRCALTGGLICDVPTAAVTIDRMNRKYVVSSPWYAAGGLVAHYAVAAVLIHLLRDDRSVQTAVASTAYLTAPISGIAAYFIFGKPKYKPVPRTAARP